MIQSIVKMLCGHGNDTLDSGRFLWCLSVVSVIIFQGIAMIINGDKFTATDFAYALSALLFSGGVGVGYKDRSRIPETIPPMQQQGDKQ